MAWPVCYSIRYSVFIRVYKICLSEKIFVILKTFQGYLERVWHKYPSILMLCNEKISTFWASSNIYICNTRINIMMLGHAGCV